MFDREADREIPRRVVGFYVNPTAYSPGDPVLRRALTQNERALLTARRDALKQALMPWRPELDRKFVAHAIDGMLGGFGANRRADPVVAAAMTVGYLELLHDAPPWAIIAACLMVRRGEAGNVAYCPNEPEFAQIVRAQTAVYAERLKALDQLLAAPVEPPQQKRLTRAELEAKLGRPISGRDVFRPVRPPAAPLTGAAKAVFAECAIRRQRNAEDGLPVSTWLPSQP